MRRDFLLHSRRDGRLRRTQYKFSSPESYSNITRYIHQNDKWLILPPIGARYIWRPQNFKTRPHFTQPISSLSAKLGNSWTPSVWTSYVHGPLYHNSCPDSRQHSARAFPNRTSPLPRAVAETLRDTTREIAAWDFSFSTQSRFLQTIITYTWANSVKVREYRGWNRLFRGPFFIEFDQMFRNARGCHFKCSYGRGWEG